MKPDSSVKSHPCEVPSIIEFLAPCPQNIAIDFFDGAWQVFFPKHLSILFANASFAAKFPRFDEEWTREAVERFVRETLETERIRYNTKLLEDFAKLPAWKTIGVLMSNEFSEALEVRRRHIHEASVSTSHQSALAVVG